MKENTMSELPVAELGRRERKKQKTRQALYDAAIELFLEKGFDDVTVAEISDKVDVDPSTFFRYFGSKEALLHKDLDGISSVFLEMFEARPKSEPLRASLLSVLDQLQQKFRSDSQLLKTRLLIAKHAPSAKTITDLIEHELRAGITAAVESRLNVSADYDPRPAIIAGAILGIAVWTDLHQLGTGEEDPNKIFGTVDEALKSVSFFFSKTGRLR